MVEGDGGNGDMRNDRKTEDDGRVSLYEDVKRDGVRTRRGWGE